MSAFLDRDTLLAQSGRTFIEVPLSLPDGRQVTARLRGPTVTERAKFIASNWDENGNRAELDMQHARLVQMSLCDEEGKLILKPTDRASMLGLDGVTIAALERSAAELWGLGASNGIKKNSSPTDDSETQSES